jgi:beta-glucanase (GH16 family)
MPHFSSSALAALALLAPSALCACASQPPASAPVPGTWEVVFEDDFSGTALNTSTWTPSNYSSIVSQYDGHAAMFIADRVAVANGNLVITTAYDPRTLDGVSYNFTSGWVDSQHKRNMTRGRFEASMRMPVANATGAWPAWWLLPEGVSGEGWRLRLVAALVRALTHTHTPSHARTHLHLHLAGLLACGYRD